MSAMRLLSLGFGLLMAAAVALRADVPGLVAAGVTVVAVLCSGWVSRAVPVAVSSAVVGLAVSDAPPLLVGLAGLGAGAYLLLRCGGAAAVTRPSMVGLLLGATVGMAATAVPVTLPWVPLAAPLAAVVALVLVVWPLRAR